MKPIISVRDLGKMYRIRSEEKKRYLTLRDELAEGFRKLWHGKLGQSQVEEFWALKDINFDIYPGEVVGIIGRNGAGKSTLLKILSRITPPTTGEAILRGRVGSLLEVGTGFHPELTGRENIYLSGAILGMSRAEIKRKFDEIVAFAEVEKFLDTPVKRYSSGMYVRLAFGVAAHLEPEILVVDEVLAVGDAQFQKKCLGKMGEVAKGGRTVLFVSHQMAAVEKLCQKGILLTRGEVQYIGNQTDAIGKYLTSLTDNMLSLRDRQDRMGTGAIKVVGIEIRDTAGNILELVQSGQTIDIYLYYETEIETKLSGVIAGIAVRTQLEVPVFLHHNRLVKNEFGIIPAKGSFVCRINRLPLPASNYQISYSLIKDGTYLDALNNVFELSVTDGDFYQSGQVPPVTHGVCLVDAQWRIDSKNNSSVCV